MRRITWGLAVAVSALVGLWCTSHILEGAEKISSAAALAGCPSNPPDAACEVTKLGWRVVDPGPPLWFRTSDELPRVEVAIAEPGRPAGGDDPVRWAKMKLAGPKGAFGAFGDCHGNLPDGANKITAIDCVVPSGPDGPRKGGMLVVATKAGLQVIGDAMPASVTSAQLNLQSLDGLVADGSGITARAARTAIAMFMGREYYLAPDAGISESTIEGVYHHWRWQNRFAAGTVDTGADYVLFKNGEAWRSPGAAPHDIDPARFKEARWDDWGTWRRAGGVVAFTMNGQAEVQLPPKDLVRYDPAGANERLEGSWTRTTVISSPLGIGGSSSSSIALHADGRFEESGFFSTYSTGTGRRDPRWGAAGPARAGSGRYRVNGYSLELTYDDGRRASALCYWGSDGNNSHNMLVMNGTAFFGGLSR